MLKDHSEAAPLRGRGGHVFSGHEDAAAVGRLEPGDEAQHRRLAAPGGTEKGHDLALTHRKGDVSRDGLSAEALLEALELQLGRHAARRLPVLPRTHARRRDREAGARKDPRARRGKTARQPASQGSQGRVLEKPPAAVGSHRCEGGARSRAAETRSTGFRGLEPRGPIGPSTPDLPVREEPSRAARAPAASGRPAPRAAGRGPACRCGREA